MWCHVSPVHVTNNVECDYSGCVHHGSGTGRFGAVQDVSICYMENSFSLNWLTVIPYTSIK